MTHPPLSWWGGRVVTVSADVLCGAVGRALIGLNDGTGASNSPTNSAANTFERLSVTRLLAGGLTQVTAVCFNTSGANVNAIFDDVRVEQSAFALGGVWAGMLTAAPRGIHIAEDEERGEVWHDEAPAHGGWRQRSIVGRPGVRLRLRRIALTETERAAWHEIDRQWSEVDYALVCCTRTSPGKPMSCGARRRPSGWAGSSQRATSSSRNAWRARWHP